MFTGGAITLSFVVFQKGEQHISSKCFCSNIQIMWTSSLAIILKQSCMEGFRSCPSRSKNLAWGMSKSNFQSDFNLLWLKSQSNFQKECNQMFCTWCSAPQQCQCCHRCLNQIWRRDTQTPDLKCCNKNEIKKKLFSGDFQPKGAPFASPIYDYYGNWCRSHYLISWAWLFFPRPLWILEHSKFSCQRGGIWNKEVVFEKKRWYLKQRGGTWNKEMVSKTKRWYLKQRGGTWNKEVVSEPMKGRLTKSTTAWRRLTRDHRHRWKSSWEEWSCERCLCPLATGRTWPSLDIQDLIVMLILSMMMTVMIYVSWWRVCAFFAILSLPMKSTVFCGRACPCVCFTLSFWAERWRQKARH